MQRRKFLVNSGLLASAMIASPSAVWSADDSNKTTVLIIKDASSPHMIHAIIKKSSGQAIHEMAEQEVTDLAYSSKGFLVTANDGKKWLAEKIIFSSYKKIDISPSSGP
jgi:hypothetical protein